jgi:hypothetical protein
LPPSSVYESKKHAIYGGPGDIQSEAAECVEAAMSIKASEVGDWLRQIVGKRDRREVVPDDNDLVLRPGPNFDLLNPVIAQNPLITQAPSPTPERTSPSYACGEAGADGNH